MIPNKASVTNEGSYCTIEGKIVLEGCKEETVAAQQKVTGEHEV